MSIVTETLKILNEHAKKHSRVLVSFSTGKDSLACLDLCSRVFEEVHCFHMFWIPGMKFVEERLKYAEQRWNVPILQVPHYDMLRCCNRGVFCVPSLEMAQIQEARLFDIQQWARNSTGIETIAVGGKRADGLWRKRNLTKKETNDRIIYPIVGWTKQDVIGYLKMQKIPIPEESLKNTAMGFSVTTGNLLWLHDEHHEDYLIYKKYFPFIEAVIKRREWYGIGKAK